jgi:hypothetical protein
VWVRRNYTEKGVLEFGKKDPEKQYENLSYSINLWEMNCSERNYNILKMSYFDKKGELIQNFEPPPKWLFITPGSMSEVLYKEVCK